MKCVSKEQFDCMQLTKKNLTEFLRMVEPYLDSKYVFIQDDYFYNHWYVSDWNEGTWSDYTDEEFRENFELLEWDFKERRIKW